MPDAAAGALANLVRWARAQGVTTDEKQRDQLEVYLDNLLLWNRRLALVSQQKPAVIADKHFADSIVAALHCRENSAIVDLGSGAGFPGMIIAIYCPTTRVTLIESRRKKATFLLDTARRARLDNVEVVPDRIETVARQAKHTSQYDVSIARALGSMEMLLAHSDLLLRTAGTAIAMKGPSFESETETTPIQRLGFATPTIHSYALPDQSQRVLLEFSRIRPPIRAT